MAKADASPEDADVRSWPITSIPGLTETAAIEG
jgi:hypothetical protein